MSEADRIIAWISQTFNQQQIKRAVIAVSGGIDSSLSLTLLTRALGTANIVPVLLPYGDQDMSDARLICKWNGFPKTAIFSCNIQPMVDVIAEKLHLTEQETVRLGNVKARVRMTTVFDLAKSHSALVCGTENKTEHYLGYFTRFGDAASDLEPICQLYKTDVRAMAAELGLPERLISNPPSAGLWTGQTDEDELGFSYKQADAVLRQLIDHHIRPTDISIANVSPLVVHSVLARVHSQAFKRAVPYCYGQ
jgi:NAD+ synthase